VSADTSARYGLSNGASTTIRAHLVAALALPAPDETWHYRDVDDLDMPALRKLRRCGAVEVVQPATDHEQTLYRTREPAFQYLQEFDPTPGPCRHRGVRCLEAGDLYTCTAEGCGVRFDAATAREIIAALDGGGA
jgi:hypothetical protein